MKEYTADYYYLNDFTYGYVILAENISQALYFAKQEACSDINQGVCIDYVVVYDNNNNAVESWI